MTSNGNMIAGVILAHGTGGRMGGCDKAALRARGTRLIDYSYEAINPQVDQVLINGHENYGYDVPVVPDLPEGPKGPLGGVYAVMQQFSGQATPVVGIITVPVDCPFIPDDLVSKLSAQGGPAIAVINDDIQPVIGYWPLSLYRQNQDAFFDKDSMSMRWFAKKVKARLTEFSMARELYNINESSALAAFDRQADQE